MKLSTRRWPFIIGAVLVVYLVLAYFVLPAL